MKQIHFSLSIPESCSESWEEMNSCASGKFCGSCQKMVIDFTGYTDAQLAAFFSGKADEPVCGRFYTHQIENKIFSYTAPVKRPYRTLAMAASVAALTVLSFTADAQEVQRDVPLVPPMTTGISAPTELEKVSDTLVIEGMVKDETGEPILNALVQVFSNSKLLSSTATDYSGNYRITIPLQFIKAENVDVKCSLFGYTTELVQGISTSQSTTSTKITFTLLTPKKRSRISTGEVVIIKRVEPPLIDLKNPGSSSTIPASSLEKMPR